MNRADECRAILDAHRIARVGVASLLECPTRESVLRRATALMRAGYRLIDVEQALTAWQELHGAAVA